MESNSFKSGKWLVPAIFLLLHVLFFLFALQYGHPFSKDSAEYLWQSFNISHNSSFYCGDLNSPIVEAWFNQRPPGYGLFLSILGINHFNFNYQLLLSIQLMLSLLNGYIVYQFVKLLTGPDFSLWLLLIPLLGFPSQFVYSGMVMSEVLFQTLLLLSVYFIAILLKRGEMQFLWWSQWSLTAALLVKPIAWMFPFVALISFLIYWFNEKVKLLAIVTFAIPFAAIFWMFNFSYTKTGIHEFSSIQRKLMINYNSFAILSDIEGKDYAVKTISTLQDSVANFKYVDKCKAIDDFNKKVLKEHFVTAAKLEGVGILKFFISHSRWDVSFFLQGKEPDSFVSSNSSFDPTVQWKWISYFVFSVFINLLVFAAFVKFLVSKDLPVKLRGCIGSIVIYMAIATGPSAASRFRLPVFPVLTVTFVVVTHRFAQKRSNSAKFAD
jgi:hypothetical protein